jgi:hypothetical protein
MAETFDSTDDKRVQNNPELDGYTGPDDVALSYRKLEPEDVDLMKSFKMDCQKLINRTRSELGSHPELDIAIRNLIDASSNITRYITRFKEPKAKVFSDPRCTFNYCPHPLLCENGGCISQV